MKIKTTIIILALAVGLVFAGCGRAACKDICEDCVSSGEDKCVDDCVEDYKDGDGDCKDAIKDWGDCVKDKGCEKCGDEAIKAAEKC